MKIDVEGAEWDVLEGAGQHLFGPSMAILVATHSAELHHKCLALLSQFDFRIIESGKVTLARTDGWQSVEDPEIIALGPERVIAESDIEFFRRNC